MTKSGRNKEDEVSPEMLQVSYKLDFRLKNRSRRKKQKHYQCFLELGGHRSLSYWKLWFLWKCYLLSCLCKLLIHVFLWLAQDLRAKYMLSCFSYSSNWIPTFIEVPKIARHTGWEEAASSCCDSTMDTCTQWKDTAASLLGGYSEVVFPPIAQRLIDGEKNKPLITHPEGPCAPPYNLSMLATAQHWIRWRIRDCWGWRKVFRMWIWGSITEG